MNHTSRTRLAVLGIMSDLYRVLVAVHASGCIASCLVLRTYAGEIRIVNYQEI